MGLSRWTICRAVLILVFFGAGLAGCYLSTRPIGADDGCSETSQCASGQVCRDGECVSVDPMPELCNGLDDDGDGEVDEGCDCADGWALENRQVCGGRYTAAWTAPDGTAFVVGERGAIVSVRLGITTIEVSGTLVDLRGVGGRSADDVYAVGESGTILHSDGASWSVMDSGVSRTLNDLWAAPSGEVIAVGRDGTILFHDGASWSSMDSGMSVELTAVWGAAADDVYVVGWEGAALHFDGRAWTPLPLCHPDFPDLPWFTSLYDVWGSGADDVHLVGDLFVHFDGDSWTVDPYHWAVAVWARGPREAYALETGGRVHRWDGGSWSLMDSPTFRYSSGLTGTGAGELLVTADSCELARFDGRDWSILRPVGPASLLMAIWATPEGDAYIVGFGGAALRYDGQNLVSLYIGVDTALYDIWGADADDIFVVGDAGVIVHYDGVGWHRMDSGIDASLFGVWGLGGDQVYAVGERGTILSWDGGAWSPMESPISDEIYGIGGRGADDLWAVGENGVFLRFDGSAWRAGYSFSGRDLHALWAVGDDLFISGSWGRIIHDDGNSLASMASGVNEHLLDIWGASPRDVYTVGISATILHWDGLVWTQMMGGGGFDLMGLGGSSANNVFAVGSEGTVLHLCGDGSFRGDP